MLEQLSGYVLPRLSYEVTQALIDAYGLASLDMNPVHMDPEWFARAKVFGTPKTVAHGMMTMSFMVSAVLRDLGPATELISVESKFTKPVPVGSTIEVSATVRDVHLIGDGFDYAVVAVEARDQDGVVVGVSEVSVSVDEL